MNHTLMIRLGLAGLIATALLLPSATVKSDPVFFAGTPPVVAQLPLYMKDAVPPLNMLVMGKDHKIYYEAYNDASDLNGDGALDIGYKPDTIDYYGYFNSNACYEWQTDKFVPLSKTADKKCSGRWSGDFLNYVTTSRMDALRRVLYGGWRQVDTATETVLQGAFMPQDGHSWGKEYKDIDRDGYDIRDYTPLPLPDSGTYHLFAITTLKGNRNAWPGYQAPVFRVLRNSPFRIWNWLSIEGPVAGNKCFTEGNSRVDCVGSGGATRDADRFVRVLSCPDDADLQESTCHAYPNGKFKPTGILHDYGETNRMYFGLITGSQRNNIEGGVLRRNVASFADEIDATSGVFKSNVDGIANSISKFRMIGNDYNGGVEDNTNGDQNMNWANGGNCVSQGDRALNNGECRMWGNPIAEMLYEGMRYFAGAGAPTPRFATGGGSDGANEETSMGLKTEAWKDPYASSPAGGGYPTCAKPYETVISDINPSYDGDLPGSAFAGADTSTGVTPANISGFDAASEGGAIWASEFGGPRDVFIGEAGGVTDGAPTPKSASSFGNIRGLSPEEPTKGGTYYSASVARFGRLNDLNAAIGTQSLATYSIALASPLPRIDVPLGSGTVTLLPFAKTVSGTFGGGARKPTNTIVDFYVQEINNFPGQDLDTTINSGLPKAIFRINYEDVEQGNDHDMDAIARYEVTAKTNGTLDVQVISEYAAGSANQYMGYTLSGTNGKDGVYLEICDLKNGIGNPGNSTDKSLCEASSTVYRFNTPPGRGPGYCAGASPPADCAGLPPTSSIRNFAPGAGAGAVQLENPLWYAAKYGSPNPTQIDADGDGTPDNYFLVTNPLNLRKQLSKAFDNIIDRELDVGVATISGARVGNSSFTLQPTFRRARNNKDWTGNLSAIGIKPDGTLGATLWSAQAELPGPASRDIRAVIKVGDGTSTGKVSANFDAAGLGSTEDERFAALGIIPGNVITLYGGAYTASNFINYLRGDSTQEATKGGTLRERSAVLGDIVNSEPVIASPKSNYGYGYYTDDMFDGYADAGGYLSEKSGRKTVAYTGANDGMLHAFDASTEPCSGDDTLTCAKSGAGKELFAFIPNAVLGNLGQLALPDDYFNHRYYVDGQMTVGDAKDGSDWKTLLIGSTGGGAPSVFALDVSDPDGFDDDNILWERNQKVDLDIGHVYGKPLLVPLENERWGVLFGNGYGGNTSDPSLYVLDAFTGELIKKITAVDANPASTGPLTPVTDFICSVISGVIPYNLACAHTADPFNGLGQITAIDKNGNGKVDSVYGGDLQGNLWKFDLSDGNDSNWVVANALKPLFIADNGSGRQPITGGIRVAAGPGTGVMVYFGTGRYFVTGDNDVPASPQVQSLYGVFDDGTAVAGGRADLEPQTIDSEVVAGGFTTRNLSRNQVFYYGSTPKRGWYIDLKLETKDDGTGERFIATPLIQSGRVFFATYQPSKDSCEPGGTNFQYGLDLLSGAGALANVQVLPTGTPACTGAACGGVAIGGTTGGQAPVMGTGVAAINPLQPVDKACDPTTESCATFEQCQVVIYPGGFVLPRPCGRQSWRQLK